MTAGPRGPTAGRDTLEALWAEYERANDRRKNGFGSAPEVAVIYSSILVRLFPLARGAVTAASGAAPAGLTVETLGRLLFAATKAGYGTGAVSCDEMAAWLLPRLGSVSPGAPAAASGVLTVARLAALLTEALSVPKEGDIHGAEWLAAWLLPRLGAPPTGPEEPRYRLSAKAVQHVELGCPLPPGHDGPCLERAECDRCDGCGWYECGVALRTTCERCSGTGVVERPVAATGGP